MHNRSKELKNANNQLKSIKSHGVERITIDDKDLLQKKGYFKLYKGYRLIKEEEVLDFEQIKELEQLDRSLKSLLFLPILDIETAIKNVILDKISEENCSTAYYTELLDEPNLCSSNLPKKKINERKARFYSECSSKYDKKHVNHYLNKNEEPPLWAYFEILTFGGITHFLNDLNDNIKINVSKEILNEENCELLLNVIYILNPLRNAIMHNEIIFDVRFDSRKKNKVVGRYTASKSRIERMNCNFDSILDYIILIDILLKNINTVENEYLEFLCSLDEVLKKIENISNKEKIFMRNYNPKILYIKSLII